MEVKQEERQTDGRLFKLRLATIPSFGLALHVMCPCSLWGRCEYLSTTAPPHAALTRSSQTRSATASGHPLLRDSLALSPLDDKIPPSSCTPARTTISHSTPSLAAIESPDFFPLSGTFLLFNVPHLGSKHHVPSDSIIDDH